MRHAMRRRLVLLVLCMGTLYLFALIVQRPANSDWVDSDHHIEIGPKPKPKSPLEEKQLDKRRGTNMIRPLSPSTASEKSSAPASSSTSKPLEALGACNYATLSGADSWTDEGLGSLLFQYASLYGIAASNRKLPFLPSTFPLYDRFDLTIPAEDDYSTRGFQRLRETDGCCRYQNPSSPCDVNVTVEGYRRSWRYFHRQRAELQKEFRLLPQLHEQCHANMSRIFADYEIQTSKCLLVGVHARVGPFRPYPRHTSNSSSSHHDFDTAEYLRRAMKHFKMEYKEEYSCIVFIVLGNDYDWVFKTFVDDRELMDFKDANTLVAIHTTGDPAVDLCMLTHTNHTIFTYGTFGWWTAYLTGGLAVYQKEYADILEKEEYRIRDYYLPEWTAL